MSDTPTPDLTRSPSLTGLVTAFRTYAEAAAAGTTPDGAVPPGEDSRDPDQRVAQAYAHCASLLTMHVDRLAAMDADRLNGPDLRAQLVVVQHDRDRFRDELAGTRHAIGLMYAAAMGFDVDGTDVTTVDVPDDPIAAVRAERANLRAAVDSACRTVAEMHAAVTGRPGDGPRRGVVEDVRDVAEFAAAARAALAKVARDLDAMVGEHHSVQEQTRIALRDLCRELAGTDTAQVFDPRGAELLYEAWAVIANAGVHFGGWETLPAEWVQAAERWRDAWHAYNAAYCAQREADGVIRPVNPHSPGPEDPAPVNQCEADADAARRFAADLWRLESGLAARGVAVYGPVGTAAVDTALRFVDQHLDNGQKSGPSDEQPAPAEPAGDPAMLPDLADYADDPAAEPNDALLRDMERIAGGHRGVAYDPHDRPAEILAVRRAAMRAGLVPFPHEQIAPPRGYRGATPPQPKLSPAKLAAAAVLTGQRAIALAPGEVLTVTVQS